MYVATMYHDCPPIHPSNPPPHVPSLALPPLSSPPPIVHTRKEKCPPPADSPIHPVQVTPSASLHQPGVPKQLRPPLRTPSLHLTRPPTSSARHRHRHRPPVPIPIPLRLNLPPSIHSPLSLPLSLPLTLHSLSLSPMLVRAHPAPSCSESSCQAGPVPFLDIPLCPRWPVRAGWGGGVRWGGCDGVRWGAMGCDGGGVGWSLGEKLCG